MNHRLLFISGLLGSAALMTSLTGCGAKEPQTIVVQAAAPAPAPAQPAVVVQDDYEYYPQYEVYYSRSRHDYFYRDGSSWVRRSEPRGVSVNVLLAAPSIHMDFHDSPEHHHDEVVRSYPKNWKRPDNGHDDRHDDDRKRP